MNAHLLVFARAPVAGASKTRLIPALGADGAANLHAELVDDTLARARAARPRSLQLWGTGADPRAWLAQAARRHDAVLHEQCAGDLGRRMQAALVAATAAGEPAIAIGCDAPTLTSELIVRAADELATHDAVLGPAHDGGYVLFGLRRVHADLFTRIEWGGEDVLATTRARLVDLGWTHAELPALADVDRPADLAALHALGPRWAAYAGPAADTGD